MLGAEVMSRSSILEVRGGILKSTLLSNTTSIGDLMLQPASKNLEIDAVSAKLESTKRLPGFD